MRECGGVNGGVNWCSAGQQQVQCSGRQRAGRAAQRMAGDGGAGLAAAQRAAQNPPQTASHLRCAVTSRPLQFSRAPSKHPHTHTHNGLWRMSGVPCRGCRATSRVVRKKNSAKFRGQFFCAPVVRTALNTRLPFCIVHGVLNRLRSTVSRNSSWVVRRAAKKCQRFRKTQGAPGGSGPPKRSTLPENSSRRSRARVRM